MTIIFSPKGSRIINSNPPPRFEKNEISRTKAKSAVNQAILKSAKHKAALNHRVRMASWDIKTPRIES